MVNEYSTKYPFGGFVTAHEADLDSPGKTLPEVTVTYRAPVQIFRGNGEDVCEVDLDEASIC